MKRIIMTLSMATVVALSAGCATTGSSSGFGDRSYSTSNSNNSQMYGTVVSVRNVEVGGRDYNGPGFGAVAGAIVGGVLGNQIGGGTGRVLATGAGAVAGGFAGNAIERNTAGPKWGQEVVVRLDSGDQVTILQPGTDISRGARVQVRGHGSDARVVLR